MTRTELEQIKNNFYKDLAKESGLSIPQIRKILAEAEGTFFDKEKLATYRAIVLSKAGAWKRVDEELKKEINRPKCLFPGCDGFRVKGNGYNEWVCSTGGSRHYWAVFVAEATKQDAKDVLVTLTDMKEKADERDAKAREGWLKAMKETKEKDGE